MDWNRNEYSTEELINNFTLTVSPHYLKLIKPKPEKTKHLEVNRHSILLVDSKNKSVS